MANREVKFERVKLLSEKKIRGNTVRLQVVKWNDRPTLEKREYFIGDDNTEKNGKAKGLNLEDLELVLSQADEIKQLLTVVEHPKEA